MIVEIEKNIGFLTCLPRMNVTSTRVEVIIEKAAPTLKFSVCFPFTFHTRQSLSKKIFFSFNMLFGTEHLATQSERHEFKYFYAYSYSLISGCKQKNQYLKISEIHSFQIFFLQIVGTQQKAYYSLYNFGSPSNRFIIFKIIRFNLTKL